MNYTAPPFHNKGVQVTIISAERGSIRYSETTGLVNTVTVHM